MRGGARTFSRLPIKWRLTIGSACMIFLCFAAYNTVQYFFVQNWMLKEQEAGIRKDMGDMLNYFLERESSFQEDELASIRNYLNRINENRQFIRILDDRGQALITVANDMPENAVEPLAVEATAIERLSHGDGPLLVMRSPITIFNFNGTVEIVRSIDEFDKLTGAIFRVMITFGLGAIVLSGLVGWLLAWQFLKPLKSMAATIRAIKSDGISARMQPQGSRDEMSTLMQLFNGMMDQVERSFEQQSRFVEDASHELRTPIAIIEGHLNLLKRWGKQDAAILEESLASSLEELLRLKRLVEELLALTKADKAETSPTEAEEAYPDQVIRSLVKKLAVVYPNYPFRIEAVPGAERLAVAMSGSHLEQVLLIVLDNAVKHSPKEESIVLRLEQAQDRVRIEIADRGAGIPAADLPFVMDRFYRADKARSGGDRGHGLGLAIAKRLIESRGGSIAIESEELRGTVVSIELKRLD